MHAVDSNIGQLASTLIKVRNIWKINKNSGRLKFAPNLELVSFGAKFTTKPFGNFAVI